MLAQASEIFGFACPAIIIPQSSLRKNLRLTKKHPALFRRFMPKKAPGVLVFSYKLGFHSWRPAPAALYRFDQISS